MGTNGFALTDPQTFSHVIFKRRVWKAYPVGCTKFKIQLLGTLYTNTLSLGVRWSPLDFRWTFRCCLVVSGGLMTAGVVIFRRTVRWTSVGLSAVVQLFLVDFDCWFGDIPADSLLDFRRTFRCCLVVSGGL